MNRYQGGSSRLSQMQSRQGKSQRHSYPGRILLQRDTDQRLHQPIHVFADFLRQKNAGRIQVSRTIAFKMFERTHVSGCSFSMFSSTPPYTDLIFQDATQQLKVIPRSKRYYSDYLGTDFMRARRIVDCHAGAGEKRIVVFNLILLMVAVFYTR